MANVLFETLPCDLNEIQALADDLDGILSWFAYGDGDVEYMKRSYEYLKEKYTPILQLLFDYRSSVLSFGLILDAYFVLEDIAGEGYGGVEDAERAVQGVVDAGADAIVLGSILEQNPKRVKEILEHKRREK